MEAKRTVRLAFSLFPLIFLAFQTTPGQERHWEKTLQQARAAWKAKKPEEAAAILYSALERLPFQGKTGAQRKAEAEIRRALAKYDPLFQTRCRKKRFWVKECLRLGDMFLKKGFPKAALSLFRLAETFHKGSAAGRLEKLGEKTEKRPAALSGKEVFKTGKAMPGNEGWTVGPRSIEPPPSCAGRMYLVSSRTFPAGFEASVKIKLNPAGHNAGGIAFIPAGTKIKYRATMKWGRHFLFILIRKETPEEVEIIAEVCAGPRENLDLASTPLKMRVESGKITIGLGGFPPAVLEGPREGSKGRCALVSDSYRPEFPVEFIDFRVLPLPAPKAANVTRTPEPSLLLESASKLLDGGKIQEAVLTIHRAEPLLERIRSSRQRRDLFKRRNALFKRLGPLPKEWVRLEDKIAKELVSLGKAYAMRRWRRTAAGLFRKAEELRPGIVPGRFKKLLASTPAWKEERAAFTSITFSQVRTEYVDSERWTFDAGVFHSPKLKPDEVSPLFFRTRLDGDYLLEAEIRLDSEYGSGELVFANTNVGNYWSIRCIREEPEGGFTITHFAQKEARGYLGMVLETTLFTPHKWIKVSLLKKGRTLLGRFARRKFLLFVNKDSGISGEVGLGVQADPKHPCSVSFRGFRYRRF